MAASSVPKLFQPIRVGTANLKHRVVLAPMTRTRADAQHVPGRLIQEYYKQRTSVPGTLAITEGTFIAARAAGYKNIPGIWSDEQIAGWKPVRHGPFPTNVVLFDLLPLFVSPPLIVAGRGRSAQKRVLHLPPALGTRAHGAPGCPTRRRRISARRAQPNPTLNEKRSQRVIIDTPGCPACADDRGNQGIRATVCLGGGECRSPGRVRRCGDSRGERVSPGPVSADEQQHQDGCVRWLGAESRAIRARGHRRGRQGRRRGPGGHPVQPVVDVPR
jgi:hypothetical protein